MPQKGKRRIKSYFAKKRAEQQEKIKAKKHELLFYERPARNRAHTLK
jgi:hypothetical protein